MHTERGTKNSRHTKTFFRHLKKRGAESFPEFGQRGESGSDAASVGAYLLMFPGATKGRFPRLIETLFRFPSADRNFCMYMRFRKETAAFLFSLSPPGVFLSACVRCGGGKGGWIKSERRARARAHGSS